MTLSLNQRAHELADRLAADADALRVAVRTLPGGTRVIDCGSAVPGGLEAGRRFAEICMGGLGSVSFAPLVLEGRWLPGLTVVTDHPALACLGSQYAGWKIDRDGYFAMASGPGRALIRAEELYDDLDVDERASTAVLCLETRDAPPDALAAYVAERAGVAPGDLTLLFAPTASLAGGVQIAARVVETALHKLHELDFDVRRVVSGFGSCPLPPVARTDPRGDRAHERRDALRRPGRADRRWLPTTSSRRSSSRLPSSASEDHGEPFGEVLEARGLGLLRDRPAAFQPRRGPPRQRRERARSFHAGERAARRPRAVVPGMIVETVTTTINPDGTVNCAAMGVEWGDEAIVIKPYRSHADAAQPRGPRRRRGQPHRRHPAVRAGRARGSAPADAAGGRGRRRRARGCLLVARGHGRRRSTRPGRAPACDARRRPRHAGASSSASTGPPMRCSRPRSSPRAPRRLPADEIRAELARLARRRRQDGRAARAGGDGLRPGARARRDRRRMTTVRVEAPARLHLGMLDASGDGPRRFGGLGVAVSRPAAVVEASATRRAHRRGPGRRARARRGAALPRRARPGAGARGARARGHPGPRRPRLRHQAGARRDGRAVRAGGAVARAGGDGAARRAGRPLGGGPVDVRARRLRRRGRPARPGSTQPAPLLTRHAMPDEWRCVLASPRPSRASRAAPRRRRSRACAPSPTARPR